MRGLIRKILREDLEYSHVTDASPESNEYEMSEEHFVGYKKPDKLKPEVEEFLFKYWSKNGTELTPFRYLNIDPFNHEKEIDILKVKFHGGFYKAYELAKKEIGIGKKVHISDGGYEFDMTPLAVGIIKKNTNTPDEDPYEMEIGVNVKITNGSVMFLDGDNDYRWDFFDLFHRDNDGIDEDTLYEVTTEISGAAKEYFYPIFEKYGLNFDGLNHNYRESWIR